MTRKQLKKIATQIEQTINSRHSTYADMQINCEVFIGTSKFAYINIKPNQPEDDRYCDTIYWPEEILAFASVYNLSAHVSNKRDFTEERRHLPVITLFIKDELED